MSNEMVYLLTGFLGVLLHTLVKMDNLKKKFENANEVFVLSKYIKQDWISIVSSFVSIFILVLVVPDIIKLQPDVSKMLRIIFGLSGWMGSSLIQGLFSGTAKRITNIIDIKTDIADGKE